MRAIVNGVKTRLENLTARLSAAEQPLCQLHLKISTVGTLAYTLNQGLLCESLMYICNVFLQQLTKKKKEGRSRTRPSRATRAGRRARAKSTWSSIMPRRHSY